MRHQTESLFLTSPSKPRNVALMIAALFSAGASHVFAQASSQNTSPAASAPEEIVVTGTLIRGIAPVGAAVTALSAEDIQNAGRGSVVDLLRSIPQVTGLGPDESRSGNSNTTTNNALANTTGGSGINLRGIGTQATLVLVNGTRGAISGILANYFDPSTIPAIALGGIDVVADGASALYGSDAISGVVNLILRKNYDGAEVQLRYGSAKNFKSNQISAVAGKAWGTGSVMFSAERSFHDPLYAKDRPNLYQDNQVAYGGTDKRTTLSSPGNILVGTVRYGIPANAGTTPVTFAQLSTTANRMSNWNGATAISDNERKSFVLNGNQELNKDVEFHGQAFYTERKFDKSYGRAGLASNQATLTVPTTNPFFVAGVPGVTTTERVEYSFIDSLGPDASYGSQKNWLISGGVRFALPGDWKAVVNVSEGRNEEFRVRPNSVQACALTGTANLVVGPCNIPTGWVAGGAIAQPVAANAFNPFGTTSANVLSLVKAFVRQLAHYKIDNLQAKADGKLFELPGGTVRAAVGVEYSKHKQDYLNLQNTDTPDNTIVRATQNGGSNMTIKSIYAEVVLPIIGEKNAISGIKGLQVSVAGRSEQYSNYGKTNNPKVGFTWDVSDSVKVRGSYGSSFRANLTQADPGSTAAVNAVNIPDYLIGGANVAALRRVGGNADLKPETAKTKTLGFELKPARGLNISATWFNVDYKDIIDTPGTAVSTSITSAAVEAQYAAYLQRRPSDAAGSAAFTALANAFITGASFAGAATPTIAANINLIVDGRAFNAGRIKTSGWDLSVAHAFEVAQGILSTSLVGTYYNKYERSFAPLLQPTSTLGLIDFPTKYALRGSAGWANEHWRLNAFANYLPGYDNNRNAAIQSVGSYTTVDSTLAYDFGKSNALFNDASVSLEIQNLFDRNPPLVLNGTQLFDASGASPIGRNVAVRISKKF